MIIVKNIVASVAIFFAIPCLYLGLTVPAFVAGSYLMLAAFLGGAAVVAAWNLSNQNKLWLTLTTILWTALIVFSSGAGNGV